MIGNCSVCGTNDTRVYYTFGKYKCKQCLDSSRTGKQGNSGMIYNPDVDVSSYYIGDKSLQLVPCKKSDPLFVKWYIEHYPKSKGIVGRTLNYLVYNEGKPIGIIGFASPPLGYKKFNNYFKFEDNSIDSENAKLFVNNNVFRIVHTKKNIGTQILKIARQRLPLDYESRYGDKLLGIVTFVEKPRNGALYLADNWEVLGETSGIEIKRRGVDWTQKQYTKTDNVKIILGYKFKIKNKHLK